MTESQRLILADTIKSAFGIGQHPHQLIGDLEELKHLVDKNWEELSISDINETEGLTFFSHKGFQYFLPAYLITILKYPDKVNDLIKTRVIRDLSQYDNVWGVWTGKLCDIFSQEQKRVIIDFLDQYNVLLPLKSKLDINSMSESDGKFLK